MDSIQNTTTLDNSNLSALTADQVLLVIRVLERTNGPDFHLDEFMLEQMKAGEGLGLLAADAATHALRRTSAWTVIDHIESFVTTPMRAARSTPVARWAQATLSQLRSGADLPTHVDAAEPVREDIDKECDARDADCRNPVDTCLVALVRYASWAWYKSMSDYKLHEDLEGELNKAAMAIVGELAHECSRSTAWELIHSLRTLGLH